MQHAEAQGLDFLMQAGTGGWKVGYRRSREGGVGMAGRRKRKENSTF